MNALSNTDSNANWAVEPNFNLNHLTKPRPASETSMSHNRSRPDPANNSGGKTRVQDAASTETVKPVSTPTTAAISPGKTEDTSWHKGKNPAPSCSLTADSSANSKVEQLMKSSNLKQTPSLSPKTHTHGNAATSPKPHRIEQTTTVSSPKTAEQGKTQIPRAESASVSKNPAVSPRTPANKTENGRQEIITVQKPETEKVSHDSGTQDTEESAVDPKSQSQGSEKAPLNTKTPHPSSPSPKPSVQRKVTGTRNSHASASKDSLGCKDSSAPEYKTSSKDASIPKARTGSKDSLDSKTDSKASLGSKDSLATKTRSDSKSSPNSKTKVASKDSPDSKSGSASKASSGSKDSLDSKSGSNSKCKAGKGSEDSLDSATTTEIKANPGSKRSPDSKIIPGSKSGTGSKDSLDPETGSDSKASLNQGSEMDLGGCISPSSSRAGLSGSKVEGHKGAGSGAEPGSDPSRPGLVQSSSKSTLVESSPGPTLSPRPASAGRGPGSGPDRPITEIQQKSLGSAPGKFTSSPHLTQSLVPLRSCVALCDALFITIYAKCNILFMLSITHAFIYCHILLLDVLFTMSHFSVH